jgi:hypothetical protein
VNDNDWEDVRRKYWFGSTYYLPIITWNKELIEENESDAGIERSIIDDATKVAKKKRKT